MSRYFISVSSTRSQHNRSRRSMQVLILRLWSISGSFSRCYDKQLVLAVADHFTPRNVNFSSASATVRNAVYMLITDTIERSAT